MKQETDARTQRFSQNSFAGEPQQKKPVLAIHGSKKELILTLVAHLIETEAVPMNKICGRIIQDLQPEIESGQISMDYIWQVVPAECKEQEHAEIGRIGGNAIHWRTTYRRKQGN